MGWEDPGDVVFTGEGTRLEYVSTHELTSLSTYLRVLRRRMWIVLVCTILVPAAALFFSLRQPAQYVASADVLLSRTNLGATLSGSPTASPFTYDTTLAGTQTELAHTPDVAQIALGVAKLDGRHVAARIARRDLRRGEG